VPSHRGPGADDEKINERAFLILIGVFVALLLIGVLAILLLVAYVTHGAGCYQPSGC
jgi:hypothetical protein